MAEVLDKTHKSVSVKRGRAARAVFQDDDASTDAISRASRLRTAVQAAGGNQAVAARSGVPLSTLGTYLAGRDMKAAAMIALADACEVSLDWLAKGVGPMKPGQPEAGRAAETRDPTLFGTVDMKRMGAAVQLAQMSFAQNAKPQEPHNFAQLICLIYDKLGDDTDDPVGLVAEILDAINVRIAEMP